MITKDEHFLCSSVDSRVISLSFQVREQNFNARFTEQESSIPALVSNAACSVGEMFLLRCL